MHAGEFRRRDAEFLGDTRPGFLNVELDPLVVAVKPYAAVSRPWITAAFIRISARSIESTSGANSSITLAFDRPFGDRRGGVAGSGADKYLRTVFRSSPVSRATSERLIAPDSNRLRKRRSSNHRCGSRTIVDRLPPPLTDQAAECRAAGLNASTTVPFHPYAGGDVHVYADTAAAS